MPDSFDLTEPAIASSGHCILPFAALSAADAPRAGSWCATLGELCRALDGFPRGVAPGFALTIEAWGIFARDTGLDVLMGSCFAALEAEDMRPVEAASTLRNAIMAAEFPRSLRRGIADALETLDGDRVMVCATTLDGGTPEPAAPVRLPNICGTSAVLDAVRRGYAELFTDRAIARRAALGVPQGGAAAAVAVQRMVRADLGAAGAMHTDVSNVNAPAVRIAGRWGVAGKPVADKGEDDTFVILLPRLGASSSLTRMRKSMGAKRRKTVYAVNAPGRTRSVAASREERERFVLSDDEARRLAFWGAAIETHYGRPMIADWAKDGGDGRLFIMDARPRTLARHGRRVPGRQNFLNGVEGAAGRT